MPSNFNQRVINILFKLDCCPFENEWVICKTSQPNEIVADRDYTAYGSYQLVAETVYLNENESYTITIYDANGDGLQNGFYRVSEEFGGGGGGGGSGASSTRDLILTEGSGNFGGIIEYSLARPVVHIDSHVDRVNITTTFTILILLCVSIVFFFVVHIMLKTRQKGFGVTAEERKNIVVHDLDELLPPDDVNIPGHIRVISPKNLID